MYTSRLAVRSTRAVRVNAPAFKRRVRFASDTASKGSENSSGGLSHGVTGGLIGGGITVSLLYLWYHFSALKTAVNTSHQMKSYVDSATSKLKVEFNERTPEPNEALDMLKQTAQKYASFVPGGRQYVDTAFKDLDSIRNKHGSEVDNIVKEAYSELKDVSSKGMNLETLSSVWEVLSKHLQRISELAVDAGQDILNNHPELKEKMGGSFDQLKQLGDRLGPDAKKQVDETWKEVQGIVQQGVQWNTIPRVQQLVQEKVQEVKKLGDKVWQQGLEQVKPMLEKNPEAKKLVEENADILKQGNIGEAFEKVKSAVQSGNIGDLQQYVDSAKSKAEQFSSGSLSKWLGTLPSGSKILPELQKLKSLAESRSDEAQQLAKDTMNDLTSVFEKRSKQLEDMYKKSN